MAAWTLSLEAWSMADADRTPTSITKSVRIKIGIFGMNFWDLIAASSSSSTIT